MWRTRLAVHLLSAMVWGLALCAGRFLHLLEHISGSINILSDLAKCCRVVRGGGNSCDLPNRRDKSQATNEKQIGSSELPPPPSNLPGATDGDADQGAHGTREPISRCWVATWRQVLQKLKDTCITHHPTCNRDS